MLDKMGCAQKVVSIGMDNAEMPGSEPGLFEKVYKKAKKKLVFRMLLPMAERRGYQSLSLPML